MMNLMMERRAEKESGGEREGGGGNDKGTEEGDERELCPKCQTDCEGVPY